MKIGILGTADIAFRRFLPALQTCPGVEYIGVASRTPEKTEQFVKAYGGMGYPSYQALLEDERVEAVYVRLPPALHYEWGKKVLLSGKHLFMEKPFATSQTEAEELLQLAEERGLAVHENYMFLYHSQLAAARKLMSSGALGELRLIRVAFGFPRRGGEDFRYQKDLGGGALLDCGGYPVRLALELLGPNVRVIQAHLVQPEGYEVDLYGNAVMEGENGLCAQLSFGMDNAYQCQLEVWGSKATLTAPRIFTAGSELKPPLYLKTSAGEESLELEADDQFGGSLREFQRLVGKEEHRAAQRNMIRTQMKQVQAIMEWRK